MLAEISAGLGSLKAAADILKGWNAAATQASMNDVKIELQSRIFEAREALSVANEAQSAALKRISELEQEIVQLKDWEREKQRYELHDIGEGRFVYRLKEGMEPPEPPHQICAHCYQNGQRSFLQANTYIPGRSEVLECHRCGSVIYVDGSPHADHEKMRPKPQRIR